MSINIYQSYNTNGVLIVPRTPARTEVESPTVDSLYSAGGQTMPDLGNHVIPMDESWFFPQDFCFDENLIPWQ